MSLVDQAKAAGLSEPEIEALATAEADQRMDAEDLRSIADTESGADGGKPSAEGGDAPAGDTPAGDGKAAEAPAVAGEPAAGDEPGGGDDPNAAAAAGAADDDKGKPASEDEPKAEPKAETTRDRPFAPRLTAQQPADSADRLKAISGERAQALNQLVSGELTPEEYADIDDRLTGEREVIIAGRTKAQLTAEHNEQIQQSLVEYELNRFLREAKGIDYADPEDRARFNRALDLVANDPSNADKTFDQIEDLFKDAHAMVCALKGVAPKVTPPAEETPGGGTKETPTAAQSAAQAAGREAAPAAATPAKARDVPNTIGALPAAAPAELSNDPLEKVATLEGDELERYIASLSKTEHEKLMRRAM
jgi:hypothetical protein